MRFFLILICVLCIVGSAYAGSVYDYSSLNLLPEESLFGYTSKPTNLNLGKIEANSNTFVGFGIGANIDKWSLCSGEYSLNSSCVDSNFNQPITQTLIGPQINFESKSNEGGFESSISYTSSKTLPVNISQSPANINRLKLDSSVNFNLSNNAQLKFIGEYKHNDIEKNPNSIINNIPKDEVGVGLKLNIGF
ncbi:hypothetical protein DESAMIL20_890 [Desulfurella amilsii]|uniref:Outer membrane protein beta-barrel domain-containing protein n=1 Tax=Desulfurella amilsii TaxID=1562698 RepID=A0A1X4XUX2_9BACT|nr:hypothetical protein [Desulfurella amilsii]OSS41337.1 hypothetical protein DESAMIL20_890 [Desulfurella amilsii]